MKKTKTKNMALIAVGVSLLIMIIIALTWYFSFLQTQMFKERSALFMQFTEKVAENVDAAGDYFWEKTQTCEEILYLQEITDEETLLKGLGHITTMIPSGSSVVIAFDQNGNYFTSDEHIGRMNDLDGLALLRNTEKQQSTIINLPYISSTNTYYMFLNKLNHEITIAQDRKITHVAIAVNLTSLQRLFTTTGFQDSCYTYLINETGRRLYKNTYSADFINGYNILSAIDESAEIIQGGTIQELEKAVTEGIPATYELNYKEESWFLSSATIPSFDCNLLLFVPTKMIAQETTVLLQGTLFASAMVLVVFIGLFILIIRTARSASKKDRQMLNQQQQATRLLEEKAAIAASANKAKSDFLSYMSHDIRTPINGIMGMTDMALRNIDNPEKVQYCLGRISSSSHHLLSLLNDVLDMSRIESGKTVAEHLPMNLTAVVDYCSSIIEGQLSTRDLMFVQEIEDFKHPNLIGDELHLRQILINILNNAVKFTPDGGKIIFRAKETDATQERANFLIEVEDTGIGMNEDFVKKLWEPFVQENRNAHGNPEGTGLGMTITKSFVEMLEGEITVKSELGKGSAFTLQIGFDIDQENRIEYIEDIAVPNIEGMKILLVEDNELNMEIAMEMLNVAGAEVICAENGKEAVDAFEAAPVGYFDVILMDMMMPVMDGLEATRIIRASEHPDGKNIPIVAMTANAFDEDVQKSKDAGMTGHLTKPVDPDLLIQTLAILKHQNNEN